MLSGSRNREIADFFSQLASMLSSMQACTVSYACRKAFAQTRGLCLSSAAQDTLLSLFDSLGKYDTEGSVQAIDLRCPVFERRQRRCKAVRQRDAEPI